MIKEFLLSSRNITAFEDRNTLNDDFSQLLNTFSTDVKFIPVRSDEALTCLTKINGNKYLVFDYTYLGAIEKINDLFYQGVSLQLGEFYADEIRRYDRHNVERKATAGVDTVLKYFGNQTQMFEPVEESVNGLNSQRIIYEVSKLFIISHEIGHFLESGTPLYQESTEIVEKVVSFLKSEQDIQDTIRKSVENESSGISVARMLHGKQSLSPEDVTRTLDRISKESVCDVFSLLNLLDYFEKSNMPSIFAHVGSIMTVGYMLIVQNMKWAFHTAYDVNTSKAALRNSLEIELRNVILMMSITDILLSKKSEDSSKQKEWQIIDHLALTITGLLGQFHSVFNTLSGNLICAISLKLYKSQSMEEKMLSDIFRTNFDASIIRGRSLESIMSDSLIPFMTAKN